MADNKVTSMEERTEAKRNVPEDNDNLVKLSKTYNFEGESISQIDFSKIENVNAKAMMKASRIMTTSGDVQLVQETSMHFALIIAAEYTEYPFEFYESLSAKDALKVKNFIAGFFAQDE